MQDIKDESRDAAKIKKAQYDRQRRLNRTQEAKDIESTRVKKAAVNFSLTVSQQDKDTEAQRLRDLRASMSPEEKETEAQRLRDFSSNMTEEKKNSRLDQMKSYNQSHRTYSASTDSTGEDVLYDIHRSCQTNKGMSSV